MAKRDIFILGPLSLKNMGMTSDLSKVVHQLHHYLNLSLFARLYY